MDYEETTMPVSEYEKHIGMAGDYLLGVIEELYGNSMFNQGKFDDCLEQLASMLEVSVPVSSLGVRPLHTRNS